MWWGEVGVAGCLAEVPEKMEELFLNQRAREEAGFREQNMCSA